MVSTDLHMKTNNNTRTSLHWAFVGALAALIGFFSVGKIQTFWDINFVVSIIIGLTITLLCGLILYHPMELVKSIHHSYKRAITASTQYLKECKIKMLARIEKEKAFQIERTTGKHKWWYRRQDMYEKQIRLFGRIQFSILMIIGLSWTLPLVAILYFFRKEGLICVSVGTTILFLVALCPWIICGNVKSFYLRRFIPILKRTYRTERARWLVSTCCPVGQDISDHYIFLKKISELENVAHSELLSDYLSYRFKQPSKAWKSFYQLLLKEEKKKFIFFFFPCFAYRTFMSVSGVVLKLVFNTIPHYVISFIRAIPSVYNFAMIFIKEFVAVLYCFLNTSARRAIFVCSVVGYFAGFVTEFLGAHVTAPFWCFGAGFVFGFIQNYVFKRMEHRLQAIIEKSPFALGRAIS